MDYIGAKLKAALQRFAMLLDDRVPQDALALPPEKRSYPIREPRTTPRMRPRGGRMRAGGSLLFLPSFCTAPFPIRPAPTRRNLRNMGLSSWSPPATTSHDGGG